MVEGARDTDKIESRQRPRVLMLFLDGVGIGTSNPDVNPFFASAYPAFEKAWGKMIHSTDAHRSSPSVSVKPINATLGVGGLPQSGTGQTALMTGMNAAKYIGKHFGPYPYSTLRPIIAERNLFRLLGLKGRSVYYANAFPQRYFDYVRARSSRMTAMAMSWVTSGYEIHDSSMLASGKALSADITNERWNKQGFVPVPVLTPEEAGKRLVNISGEHEFVLYEFYFTDHAGHSRSMREGVEVLTLLDHFLEGVLKALHEKSTTFIVTSDHGNLEDLSTKSHTRNPVPLLAAGRRHAEFVDQVEDLTDVSSAIINMLS